MKPYILEAPYSEMANNLRDGMETIALAHEYSHIHFGHLEKDETKKLKISDEDAEKILYSWEQEFEADFGGMILTLGARVGRGWDLPLSYWGAELFFSCLEFIEKGICIINNGHDDFFWRGGRSDGPLSSHPPADRRKEQLRKTVSNTMGNEVTKLAKDMELIIQKLWEKTRPKLIEHYKSSNNLNVKWQHLH